MPCGVASLSWNAPGYLERARKHQAAPFSNDTDIGGFQTDARAAFDATKLTLNAEYMLDAPKNTVAVSEHGGPRVSRRTTIVFREGPPLTG
jgi:hypothetical protein